MAEPKKTPDEIRNELNRETKKLNNRTKKLVEQSDAMLAEYKVLTKSISASSKAASSIATLSKDLEKEFKKQLKTMQKNYTPSGRSGSGAGKGSGKGGSGGTGKPADPDKEKLKLERELKKAEFDAYREKEKREKAEEKLRIKRELEKRKAEDDAHKENEKREIAKRKLENDAYAEKEKREKESIKREQKRRKTEEDAYKEHAKREKDLAEKRKKAQAEAAQAEFDALPQKQKEKILAKRKTDKEFRDIAETKVNYGRSKFQRIGLGIQGRIAEKRSQGKISIGSRALLAAHRGVGAAAEKLTDVPVSKQIKGGWRRIRRSANERKEIQRDRMVKEEEAKLRKAEDSPVQMHQQEKAKKSAQDAARAARSEKFQKVRDKVTEKSAAATEAMKKSLDKLVTAAKNPAWVNALKMLMLGAFMKLGGVIRMAMTMGLKGVAAVIGGGKAALGAASAAATAGAGWLAGKVADVKSKLPTFSGGSTQPPAPTPPANNNTNPRNKTTREIMEEQRRNPNRARPNRPPSPQPRPTPAKKSAFPKVPGFVKEKGEKIAKMFGGKLVKGVLKKAPLALLGPAGLIIGGAMTAYDMYTAVDAAVDMLTEGDANTAQQIQDNSIQNLESPTAGNDLGKAVSLDAQANTIKTKELERAANGQSGSSSTLIGGTTVNNNTNNTNNYGSPFHFDNSHYQTSFNKGSSIIR